MFKPMFVPPRHNEALYRLAFALLPQLARALGPLRGIRIPDEDLERLRGLMGGRVILAPNHPTEVDAWVMFWLSRTLRTRFNFLSTRENLEGLGGAILNHLGVYSVIRGFPDRESIRTTRRLLAELDRKVVIFPEGLTYQHNDRLMQFQCGVAQIGFWALDDLDKAGRPPNMPLAPIAIKYRCCAPHGPVIERALADLERTLGLPAQGAGSWYQRLYQVGGRAVEALERAEGLKPQPETTLSDRIESVRRAVLSRVARAIDLSIDWEGPRSDQLYRVFNELRSWVGTLDPDHSNYEERLYRQKLAVATPLFAEVMRLYDLVAVSGTYVAEEPSAERFLEVLGRLQREVFGKVRYYCPLEAHLRAAPALQLDTYYTEYRKSKRQVVADVTRTMAEEIQSQLRGMSDLATSIEI